MKKHERNNYYEGTSVLTKSPVTSTLKMQHAHSDNKQAKMRKAVYTESFGNG